MKSILSPVIVGALSVGLSQAAVLTQTFESGESTANWGSSWNNGSTASTFLDSSLGGTTAGDGTSRDQSFYRSFRSNTAGLSVTTDYSMSMYVEITTIDDPASGNFEIMDGEYGSDNTANLKVATTGSPGSYVFQWQAKDNGSFTNLGITMELGTPYRVEFVIHPSTFTYDAKVQKVQTDGTVVNTGTLSNLAFSTNTITNGKNGQLRFYIQASGGGGVDVKVDNISIQTVPEPSAAVCLISGVVGLVAIRRRGKSCHG